MEKEKLVKALENYFEDCKFRKRLNNKTIVLCFKNDAKLPLIFIPPNLFRIFLIQKCAVKHIFLSVKTNTIIYSANFQQITSNNHLTGKCKFQSQIKK